MPPPYTAILLLLLAPTLTAFRCPEEGSEDCSDELAVHIPDCESLHVPALASEHGFRSLGPIGSLPCFFLLLRGHRGRRRRQRRALRLSDRLSEDERIDWLQSQRRLRRAKRDGWLQNLEEGEGADGDDQHLSPRPQLPWRDPLYKYQWYLTGGGDGGYDMGVRGAWLAGYTGRNVTVTILDDGIQPDHPDLAPNYEPLASYDVNDRDDDPTPQNNGMNKHGTRCAGEVSAVAGNEWCGVGVAYNSKIGGVRLLDGRVTDSVEATSLSHHPQVVDIFSASWGPDDDGRTLDGPGPLARQAFHSGVVSGRGGRGSIFVWASGNGGSRSDSCSYDGYTTSIYTLSISSASIRNQAPWYLERCPATIATTYSSGTFKDAAVVSTDMPSSCTRSQTGTSASAPMAAGIAALALEANPELTWRDIQHLVIRTADPSPLLTSRDWNINAVGRKVSNTFGYGLMNASAMVGMAKVWETVPEQHLCTYTADIDDLNPLDLRDAKSHNLTLIVTGCKDSEFPVYYLEHVQVSLKVKLSRRGALKALLRSPSGTEVVLLPGRSGDSQRRYADFTTWPILSVATWGEDPRGNWTLTLDLHDPDLDKNEGVLYRWSLLLYGTEWPAQTGDPTHAQRRAEAEGAKDPGTSSAPGRRLLLEASKRRRWPPPYQFLYPNLRGAATLPCAYQLSIVLAGLLVRLVL